MRHFLKITNIVSSFHEWLCIDVFVVCSTLIPTHVFLDIWIGRSSNANSLHVFEVSMIPICRFSSRSFPMSMDYFPVVLHLGWDMRQLCLSMDTVILEGIRWEISKFVQSYGNLMSLFIQIFHVVWSCMEDGVLHNVLHQVFSKNVIHRLCLCGAHWSAWIWMWSLVDTYLSSSIKKKNSLGITQICLVVGREISCFSMTSLAYTLRTKPWSATTSPTFGPIIKL